MGIWFEIGMAEKLEAHKINKKLKKHDTELIKKFLSDNDLSNLNGGDFLNFLHLIRQLHKDIRPLNEALNYCMIEKWKRLK